MCAPHSFCKIDGSGGQLGPHSFLDPQNVALARGKPYFWWSKKQTAKLESGSRIQDPVHLQNWSPDTGYRIQSDRVHLQNWSPESGSGIQYISRSSGRSIHDPGKIRNGCGSGMSATFYGGSGGTGQFFPKTSNSLV